ncbi:MAG TPA: hypothetical protein DDY59_12085 [Lachnospiraceae bacterium]|nr:hypothetical protein [Lachnospiraceae bacterium]
MEKFLFLSDIDGTLLRGSSGIGEGVKTAARKFISTGGLLTLCTGRSRFSTRWIAEELGIQIPCILYNGAGIYDFSQDRYLKSFPLPEDVLELVRKVYDFYPGISIQVYTKDNIYMIRTNEYLAAHGVQEEMQGPIYSLVDVRGEILKITMVSTDRSLLKQCGEEVFNNEQLRFDFASRHFAEVYAREAGKEAALHIMAEHYGVKIKNVFSAGDGMTDLQVLKASGYSFAPVNAPRQLLEVCSMVIPACEDGGMGQAFNRAIEMMNKEMA